MVTDRGSAISSIDSAAITRRRCGTRDSPRSRRSTRSSRRRIACDFAWVPGYLHAPARRHRPQGAPRHFGMKRRSRASWDSMRRSSTMCRSSGPGRRVRGAGAVHPRQYLAGVARAIAARRRRHIYRAQRGRGVRGRAAAGEGERTHDHVRRHRARDAHAADGQHAAWRARRSSRPSSRCTPPTSSADASKKGRIADALFWDTADPYHYLRIEPHRDHDFVIFGGEDHKTGQADDTDACYDRLERTLAELVPRHRSHAPWSGQVIETPDGLPYIGDTAAHQFAATGFSGNGLTFGTLAAIMAADRMSAASIRGANCSIRAARKSAAALWNYVRENKDYPYYMIRDRFAGATRARCERSNAGRARFWIPTADGRGVS